ncbi:Protein TonB [Flavobacterium aquidurense]|uniref:Protein TonB n=1 Tax=Flavobacterium aquidurense TaxID=362413 RepID=A0A0Q1BIN5_9FLAO|nr:Protein TonB [Flavobacterium aquidurense]
MEYVQTDLKKLNVDKNDQGQISANFIVEMNGSLTNVKISKDSGIKIRKRLKEILEDSPKWLPGEHEGYHVRTKVKFNF